jgi:hypothetical protein
MGAMGGGADDNLDSCNRQLKKKNTKEQSGKIALCRRAP